MNFDVDSLKVLRERTGAGMMDCRKALVQADGEIEAAQALIREWGLNEVEKRAQRKTSEGCVAVARRDGRIALAALACETDFVARNQAFIDLAKTLADRAIDSFNVGSDPGLTADLGRRMKENIVLKGIALLEVGEGDLSDYYVHGDGKIAAAVKAAPRISIQDSARAMAAIHDLCLQVAAKKPLYGTSAEVPKEVLSAKEADYRTEMESDPKLAGKPQAMIQGILAGRMEKWLSESCLLEQWFIKADKLTVGQYLAGIVASGGPELEALEFRRLAIGDD
ncbi:MAG: elongation factor T [Spirochaetes bacterium]|nr:MAG: elongation factor T [Spirochaetota bacterium]